MLMSYFGIVIVIYVYFNNNIKKFNEFFKNKFKNNFKCEVKNLELTTKKNVLWFSKDYVSHQKTHERNCILNDYMQNIYFGFDEI